MKKLIIALTFIAMAFHGNGQTFEWAKSMGGAIDDKVNSIAIDASGKVYTTGFFKGICDFDPSLDTANLTSAGVHDIFICKLDSLGNFIWAKQMGGTSFGGKI